MRPDPSQPHASAHACVILPPDSICSYSPYSVMTVESVTLPQGGAQPSATNPTRVVIVAALDNQLEPKDLPLAPWA